MSYTLLKPQTISDFEYREINYETDIYEITDLINNNLDPLISKDFLKWKHLKNPFGKSYGLVALYNGKIVGLRLFMFWQFINSNEEIIRAIRPVDTVTAKEFRGKGLFKKLTLKGLKDCSDRYDLIFNTPNLNSFPGYVKMGWVKIENSPHFKLGILNVFIKQGRIQEIEVGNLLLNPYYNFSSVLSTHKSKDFLFWRYSSKNYKAVIWEDDYSSFVIYNIIRVKYLRCIIVYEIFGKKSVLNKLLHSLGKKLDIYIIYYLNTQEFECIKFLKTFKRQQPVIVVKKNKNVEVVKINFSLGDLEGKL